ncbi:unnamed protein product [Closterium sp. NIES-53]
MSCHVSPLRPTSPYPCLPIAAIRICPPLSSNLPAILFCPCPSLPPLFLKFASIRSTSGMDNTRTLLLRRQSTPHGLVPSSTPLISSIEKRASRHHRSSANPQRSPRLTQSPGVAAFPRSVSSPAIAPLPRSLSSPAPDAMSSAACGFFSGVSPFTTAPLSPLDRCAARNKNSTVLSNFRRRSLVRAYPFLAEKRASVTASVERASSSGFSSRSTTAAAQRDAHGAFGDAAPIDCTRAVTPSSSAVDSASAAPLAVTPPRTEAVAKLPSPKMDRRTLLGLSLATLAATGAAELGLVDAAFAKTVEPPKKQPMWFLGDAAGGVDGEGGLLGKSGPAASKTRVYDATTVGEPALVGDKTKAWERLLAAKVVYLGEAEVVRDPTDKAVALEILRKLRDESFAAGRPVTLALSAFPRSMQPLLDKFIGGRLPEDELQVAVNYWPKGRFQEMLPLLCYCREAGIRLFACGVPPKVLRTVQAGGIQALSPSDRKKYAPPLGGGSAVFLRPDSTTAVPSYGGGNASAFSAAATSGGAALANGGISSISGGNGGLLGIEPIANAAEPLVSRTSSRASFPFGPGPYWFAQARVVEDHAMAGAISQAMSEGGKIGLLVVLTGASHVRFGANGRGVPSRVADWLRASPASQAVVLLNPERQRARLETDFPEADFFWYSGSWACTRNCFDRAEIARVMGAAGRTPDALPRDLQVGIERGLISPDTLQSFFELENNPLIAEATKRFEGLRERFYADPRFLQRLCTEEAISIATSLAAQFQKRGDRFWSELEYVSADILRGTVVNFFSVWLPAPRLSFRDAAGPAAQAAGGAVGEKLFGGLTAWISSLPHNAFQMAGPGQNFGLAERIGTVVVAGTKLFSVGFVSSVATLSLTNFLADMKNKLPAKSTDQAASGQVSTNEEFGAAGVAGGSAVASGTAAAAATAGEADANGSGSTVARSPVFKTALVYGAFLSTSANLRYQAIAGIVEHWIADYYLASNPVAGTAVSFLARTTNSYWGTSVRCPLVSPPSIVPVSPSVLPFLLFCTSLLLPVSRSPATPQCGTNIILPFCWRLISKTPLLILRINLLPALCARCLTVPTSFPSPSPPPPYLQQWVDLARFTGLQQSPKPAAAAADAPAAAVAATAALPAGNTVAAAGASDSVETDAAPTATAAAAVATAAASDVSPTAALSAPSFASSSQVSDPSLVPAYAGAYATAELSFAAPDGVASDEYAFAAQLASGSALTASADVAATGFSATATAAAAAPSAVEAGLVAADSSGRADAAEDAAAAEVAAVVEFGEEAVAAVQAGARLVPVEVLSDRDVLNYHSQQQQQHN